jgi:hypothetical protein
MYGQRESQSLVAPARWNGHQSLSAFSGSNSGQYSTVPLDLNGSSHQNLDQKQEFFPTSSHGNGNQRLSSRTQMTSMTRMLKKTRARRNANPTTSRVLWLAGVVSLVVQHAPLFTVD